MRDEGDQQTKLPEVVHPIMQDRREAQISSVLLAMRSLWIAGGSVYISINLKDAREPYQPTKRGCTLEF